MYYNFYNQLALVAFMAFIVALTYVIKRLTENDIKTVIAEVENLTISKKVNSDKVVYHKGDRV